MGSTKVSLSKDVLRNLTETRERLSREWGFLPTYSATIAYLLRHARPPR